MFVPMPFWREGEIFPAKDLISGAWEEIPPLSVTLAAMAYPRGDRRGGPAQWGGQGGGGGWGGGRDRWPRTNDTHNPWETLCLIFWLGWRKQTGSPTAPSWSWNQG